MPFIVPRPKLGHFGGGREIRQATSCMYETVHGPMSTPRMQAWVVGNVLTTAVVSCTGLSSILEKSGVKWRGKRERERKKGNLLENQKILKTSFLRVYLSRLLGAPGGYLLNVSHKPNLPSSSI